MGKKLQIQTVRYRNPKPSLLSLAQHSASSHPYVVFAKVKQRLEKLVKYVIFAKAKQRLEKLVKYMPFECEERKNDIFVGGKKT